VRDVLLYKLALTQRNRVARHQLKQLGFSDKAIRHRVGTGRLVRVHEGVFALPPVLEDDLALWKGVTLTAPRTFLNRLSAACAWGVLERRPSYKTVVRPGTGGPETRDGILIFRSRTLEGETTRAHDIPITTVPRTLLDLATFVSDKALARALREAIRLELTTMRALGDHLGRFEGRNGLPRLCQVLARYKALPLERARSGAEIAALEVLHRAGRPMPRLNAVVAGEEADLVWVSDRLIVEIDGKPYHLDKGADARKEAAWRDAGWRVARTSSDDIYKRPHVLLALAPR
jgi:hypothetical protein